jgi:Zn-dependent peptidase ImmA (M78 family)
MKLQLKRLSYNDVGDIAFDFLKKYHQNLNIPIPIEEIAEGELHIEIIPVNKLKILHDTDGCLDSSLSKIFIDMDLYMKYENRTRFTIAHEIGHLILHKTYFENLDIHTVEDIYNISDQISDDDYGWLEYQAYSFAGQVLVPKDILINEVEKRLGEIPKQRFLPEKVFSISQELLEIFGVSGEVLLRRLQKADIINSDGV